ncbi:hypothetical protein HMPREF0379_1067, partial [[Eubacterium] yurii subsp. margaretiae ATCC 43715]
MVISLIVSIVNVKYGNKNPNIDVVLMPFISIYIFSFLISKNKRIVNSKFYNFLSNK